MGMIKNHAFFLSSSMTSKLYSCLLGISIFISLATYAQSDEKIILDILDRQTKAWNNGDIEGFMKGYWENDSLMYMGKSGVTYGYHNTMNRYKKNYSDTTIMGKLKFTILHVNRLSKDVFQVIGKFHLTRTIGDAEGHYSLIFRRIKGEWVIVSDHSS